jgi:protein-tyrosine phosphatase
MSSRAGVNEILPGQLYQRGNFLAWPAAQKHEMLKELGIDLVLNVWLKVDPDLSGMMYLNVPLLSRSVPPAFDYVCRAVAASILKGHVALVHCEAGKNRSVFACARIVMLLNKWSADQAMDYVLQRVPNAKVNDHLLEFSA